MASNMTHRSHAQWPDGTIASSKDGSQVSTDNHHSEEEARGVCNRLELDGYGGDNKIFPVKTWVTPIPFEELYPEEGQILADICQERGEQKDRGVRLKPMFLDATEPVRVETTAGRNDTCPCGSGKKYKKCCIK